MNDDKFPIVKVLAPQGFAWLGHSLADWSQVISILSMGAATFCSVLWSVDWLWKRFGKAYAIRRGWIAGRPRAWMDTTGAAPFDEGPLP